MLDRFGDQLVLRKPGRGAPVQLRFQLWVTAVQTLAQQIGKKMVITIPAPFVIQWDEEEVGAFECFENLLRRGDTGFPILAPPSLRPRSRSHHTMRRTAALRSTCVAGSAASPRAVDSALRGWGIEFGLEQGHGHG